MRYYYQYGFIIIIQTMGGCMGVNSIPSNRIYFHEDRQLQEKTQIYNPLTASLYNTLRKNNDVVVVYANLKDKKEKIINIIEVNLQTMSLMDMKMLLNFKKIIFVGDYQVSKKLILNKIRPSINYSKFYVISQIFYAAFIKQYPIFKDKNYQQCQVQPKKLPILAINSNQFVYKSEPNIKIYIHSSLKKDLKLYSLLSISGQQAIINDSKQTQKKKMKQYYNRSLESIKAKNIVLLHSNAITSEDILEILSDYLVNKFQIKRQNSYIYLKKSLPSANLPEIMNQEARAEAKPQNDIVDSQTKFKKMFIKLQDQAGAQKTQRAYNLLSTLIVNIYSNPSNEQMYRKVKITNKQMNQLLTRYKSGLKLLNQLGFNEKQQHWVNATESKYLKIFKTNFDIGFKRYKNNLKD